MEEEKKMFCKNCLKFNYLYFKSLLSFEKHKLGYCSKKNKLVEPLGVCKTWHHKYNLKNMRLKIANKLVCKMAEDLSVICQILTEEEQDN